MSSAPKKLVTLDLDEKMRSWFDLKSIPILQKDEAASEKVVWSKVGQDDINLSADYMLQLAEVEAKLLGGDIGKVFIGGFSQGCMVSLAAFLK